MMLTSAPCKCGREYNPLPLVLLAEAFDADDVGVDIHCSNCGRAVRMLYSEEAGFQVINAAELMGERESRFQRESLGDSRQKGA